jgi:hypothetical protein
VIQQGRTNQHTSKATSKDELVSMIQYGAENIFKSTDSTITDDNIEEILKKSEQKTAELENRYKSMGLDDLQKLTVSDGTAYTWEGEDFRKKGGIGLNWIGPSKRERKENYSYRLPGSYSRVIKEKIPKPKNALALQDFQFWPERLYELQEKEKYFFWKEIGYKPQSGDEITEDQADPEAWLAEETVKIDQAEPLTETEIKEKEELATQGFSSWSKRDFGAFCKANEKYGRANIESIAFEIEGKSVEQVKAYADVFWSRYKEISDYERILSNIEKGESKLQKVKDVQELLTAKIGKLRLPLQQLKIPYNQSKGKNYTEEEDRFLASFTFFLQEPEKKNLN